ncbi:MAG: SOS response-associated peptidase family protein [Lachnospiraceae bacterium]
MRKISCGGGTDPEAGESFSESFGKACGGDVYPSQEAAILCLADGEGGTARTVSARLMRWGYEMAPHTRLLINARAETIDSRSAFREDYALRRCVIPASGFYEWKRTGRESVKYEFTDPGKILFLAGIFRPEGDSGRFLVITTAANRSMIPVHDRMPVLMGAEEIGGWSWDPGGFPGNSRAAAHGAEGRTGGGRLGAAFLV